MNKIVTTLKTLAPSVSFAVVAKAMDQSNISSSQMEGYETFQKEMGIDGAIFVPMANHSVGGRRWDLEEGTHPAFFKDNTFDGGWYLLREEEVKYLECVSMTSDSTLRAWKNEDGSWDLACEVPQLGDGTFYKGAYYAAFQRALGLDVAAAA